MPRGKMTVFGNPGSLISGTMRPHDLIPTFTDKLERLTKANPGIADNPERRKMIAHINKQIQRGDPYFESDEASEDLEALFNSLNEFAPDHHHFSSHEGDGADYGYWYIQDDDDLVERMKDTLPQSPAEAMASTDTENA